MEITIDATRFSKVPATILIVAGTEIKTKVELLDLISEAIGVHYRVEESEGEECAWVT